MVEKRDEARQRGGRRGKGGEKKKECRGQYARRGWEGGKCNMGSTPSSSSETSVSSSFSLSSLCLLPDAFPFLPLPAFSEGGGAAAAGLFHLNSVGACGSTSTFAAAAPLTPLADLPPGPFGGISVPLKQAECDSTGSGQQGAAAGIKALWLCKEAQNFLWGYPSQQAIQSLRCSDCWRFQAAVGSGFHV